MKKITLLFLFCSFFYLAKASVILDETFDYAVANLVDELTWTHSGTITTGTGRNIEAGGLVYSNEGGTYIFSGIGKKINHDYSAGSNYISYKTFPAVSSGVIYLSYLYQASGDQGQTASEVLGLAYATNNSAVKPWVGKQADQTKNPFRMGITRSSTSSGDIQWGASTLDKDNVYLIVVKYDFSTLKASLFVNPVIASAEEPAADASDDALGTARTSLSYLMFKHNGSSLAKFYVSGVRISTTWAEAVAKQSTAPQLDAPVVGAATAVSASGFTANWTAVSGAVGYDVKVFLGENLISTNHVAGQATESLEISGLMPGLTYTYKVVASGDGEAYSDSDYSAASEELTTSDPYAANTINTDLGDGSWGVPVESLVSGSYGSYAINGFELESAVVYAGSARGIKGESHTNRIAMDRASSGGKITLPTVNSVEQIEIHATAGTAGNGFLLKEFDAVNNVWTAVGDMYVYDEYSKNSGLDSIYIISVSRAVPTKFRIENPTNGSVFIYQVITRITAPTLLDKPAAGTATGISSTGFTANWTPVDNAGGYKIWVYQGSSLAGTEIVSGQAVSSVGIAGLAPETEYSYKVQAIGDEDVNYSDSFLSLPSEMVTTLSDVGTGMPTVGDDSAIRLIAGNIVTSSRGNISVYNLSGALVAEGHNTESLDVSALPAGIYIAGFISSGQNRILRKITIY